MSSDTHDHSLAPSTAFELLADPCRRGVLYVLFDTGEPMRHEQLIERMLQREVTSFRDRRRLRLELHHAALPKLTATRFVHYDERTRRLHLTDPESELKPYLAFAQSMEPTRTR
ncbi:DUF7344 domain-containing protein [Haloprofundus halobius]|uniref:DUF7344 domain-containing protein n=1 Tax=Haloprofundus halobius TaxID=2876194 RepID=UPI001CCBC3E6|nr:hypothetical protein [Haloprofundus halobius]